MSDRRMNGISASIQINRHGILNLALRCLVTLLLCAGGDKSAYASGVAPDGWTTPLQLGDRVVANAADQESISFVLSLPYPNQAALDDFLARVYNPADPLFHHFLKPADFDRRFAPATAQYEQLKSTAKLNGLRIEHEYDGRTLLDVSAPISTVRNLFGTQIQVRETAEGKRYFAPDREPSVPSSLATLGAVVAALDKRPAHRISKLIGPVAGPSAMPAAGTGGAGSLTPPDIHKAYNINPPMNFNYRNDTILVELSSATYSDVNQYAAQFGLPTPSLIFKNVDGGTTDTSTDYEVILDIDMITAINPGGNIVVYTASSNNLVQHLLDIYAQIAQDPYYGYNQVISSSWFFWEFSSASQTEAQSFQKLAAQGSAVFACSDDAGAYNGTSLAVADPASQPYVTGVGGTVLRIDSAQNYLNETAWWTPSDTGQGPHGTGGGGGISSVWPIPSYQQNIVSHAPAGQFSTSMRNVPDVSLAGDYDDPDSSYVIYLTRPNGQSGWYIYSGTSAAAPLWAGFWGLVGDGLYDLNAGGSLGFANPPIYALAKNATSYANDFHDVTSGSNNYYSAVTGYDDATGWGSFNAASLYSDIVNYVTVPNGGVPVAPTSLSAVAGSHQITLSWNASTTPGVYYSVYASTQQGSEKIARLYNADLYNITGTSVVYSANSGTTYYFVVRAETQWFSGDPPAYGYRSPASNEVSATPY